MSHTDNLRRLLALLVAADLVADAIESLELADPDEKRNWDDALHGRAIAHVYRAFSDPAMAGALDAPGTRGATVSQVISECPFCATPAVDSGWRLGMELQVCEDHRRHLTGEQS